MKVEDGKRWRTREMGDEEWDKGGMEREREEYGWR